MQYRFAFMLRSRLGLAVVAIAAAAGLSPVGAQDASPWATDTYSQVRLIAGSNAPRQPALRAGVEIKLAPGWKTYWRYPGDSGIPPQFDFAASTNVKTVKVSWPAPERMADGGGQSIGYHDRVIMPLRVVLEDPNRPATLTLKLRYAVCDKLCVPAEAAAQLKLAPAESSQDGALTNAEAQVPRPTRIGAAAPLAILAVHSEDASPRQRVVVDVAAPKDEPVDLFVEGPTPRWALPLPEPKGSPKPGTRRFVFELDGLPAGAEPKGAELTLTLVAGNKAIEAKTRLD